ncbi:MAG: tyrosine--tRNA ligase [Candidatus Dojkabacteria bacterium]
MEVKTDQEIIERILEKGVEQILPSKEALQKLLESRKRINVYQGFDPTANTLHIGHTVGMRKLEDFRKLGHHVIFLIGDFTARIGDPTDKTSSRVVLTKEQVENNMQSYIKQASKIINIEDKENPVEILYNSQWHDDLTFKKVIELASEFTVQQMIKRDMFQKRLESNKPIYLNEFLYPLMQGYDSVMMDIDVEIGGNDQLFNMLAGRDMILNHLKKEKIVLAGKLLTASDGNKMGKSEGNMITLNDTPEDIYGKVMAFSDDMILRGFEILTFSTLEELEKYKARLEGGENPMSLKKELALTITSEITTKEEAEKAQAFFESVFQRKDTETKIPEKAVNQKEILLNDLLVEIQFTDSKAQAKRLVEQGAVRINDEKQTQYNLPLDVLHLQPFILKVGKNICKITYQP